MIFNNFTSFSHAKTKTKSILSCFLAIHPLKLYTLKNVNLMLKNKHILINLILKNTSHDAIDFLGDRFSSYATAYQKRSMYEFIMALAAKEHLSG